LEATAQCICAVKNIFIFFWIFLKKCLKSRIFVARIAMGDAHRWRVGALSGPFSFRFCLKFHSQKGTHPSAPPLLAGSHFIRSFLIIFLKLAIQMTTVIQTPRFVIRPFRADEEDMYLRMFDDDRVIKYLPVRTRQEHIKIFRDNLGETAPGCITGRWGMFAIDDNDFIGMCLLRIFEEGGSDIELGYSMHYNYWGKGIASEMANALLSHMLSIQPGTTFVAVTELENIASQRVLEKAGMQRMPNYFRNGEELAYFKM
jgi:ribosomal-protein-alanine N-acetyltransferase